MAFEVFDDVAFYWFLQVLLGLFLLPGTFYELYCFCTKIVPVESKKRTELPRYLPTRRMKEKSNNLWSMRTIVIAALWVLFILLLLQLPKFHNQMLTDFNPYEILDVEKGADMRTIKRAYRKMSLKWHPDKNPDKEKAEQKFIMVNKAYQTLTDEMTRENYEKYGNPDGYQGQSVTIGLPSFLISKNNELKVLLLYFFSMMVLCVVVGTWWRWSTRFHKSGVLNDTFFLFWNRLKPGLKDKTCIEILAGSDEFRELELMMANMSDAERQEMHNLNDKLKEDTTDDANYTKYATTLLAAHLTPNLEVPVCLRPMMTYLLRECPKLLDVMIDMCFQRQFVDTGKTLINLKQRVVQGRRLKDDTLRQLPYYSEVWEKTLKQHKIRDITDFIKLDPEKLGVILDELEEKRLLEADSRRNFTLGLRMYPHVEVQYCARTYDEDTIFVDDVVTITVNVKRFAEPWKSDPTAKLIMTPPEKKNKQGDRRDYKDDDGLSFVDESIENKRRLNIKNFESPIVHTLYPFQMREKWVAILHFDPNKGKNSGQGVICITKAIPALIESETLTFLVPAKYKGAHTFTLDLKCDSYYGLDLKHDIVFEVESKPEEEEEEEEEDYDIPEDEEVEPEVFWYYLWGSNIWEALATAFLLYFLYLIVISSTYGQRYLQPVVNKITNVTTPLYNVYVGPHVNSTFETFHEAGENFAWIWESEELESEDDFIFDHEEL